MDEIKIDINSSTDEKDAEIARLAAEVERVKKKEAARGRRNRIIFKVFISSVWVFNGLMIGGLAAKIVGG